MSTARKPSPRRPSATHNTAALPAALAKQAKARHDARLARLAVAGHAAIARIRERQTDITASAVDIGLALAELKVDGMVEALGRKDFAQMCSADLGMSVTTANDYITLATRAPRETVKILGVGRTLAALGLVDALRDGRSLDDVVRAPVTLPSGQTLHVSRASVREVREAGKQVRAARAEGEGDAVHGFSASTAEKRAFKDLVRRLGEAPGMGAVRLVAARNGGAKVRFEVRLADIVEFASLFHKAARG